MDNRGLQTLRRYMLQRGPEVWTFLLFFSSLKTYSGHIFLSNSSLPFPKQKYLFFFSLVLSIPHTPSSLKNRVNEIPCLTWVLFSLVIWPAHTPWWASLCFSLPGVHPLLYSAQNQTPLKTTFLQTAFL